MRLSILLSELLLLSPGAMAAWCTSYGISTSLSCCDLLLTLTSNSPVEGSNTAVTVLGALSTTSIFSAVPVADRLVTLAIVATEDMSHAENAHKNSASEAQLILYKKE
ncbi:hypothetical protein BKA56DRAFT_619447 [Ilyonectria sp. MPI-CAGE-AT-0026]|nr:hypothetical protein BKA56DRAFT_619447 [Ilyonectria sp. MPI-CAGE-AT-0026]